MTARTKRILKYLRFPVYRDARIGDPVWILLFHLQLFGNINFRVRVFGCVAVWVYPWCAHSSNCFVACVGAVGLSGHDDPTFLSHTFRLSHTNSYFPRLKFIQFQQSTSAGKVDCLQEEQLITAVLVGNAQASPSGLQKSAIFLPKTIPRFTISDSSPRAHAPNLCLGYHRAPPIL